MPLRKAGTCVAKCAVDVAAYIAAQTPGFVTQGASDLGSVKVAQGAIDAAPVTIHRLNRSEYNNTVRDLFGTTQRPADGFPDDDFGYGFNNISNVLSTSPTHLEKYFAAADLLVAEAINGAVISDNAVFNAVDLKGTGIFTAQNSQLLYGTGSNVQLTYTAEQAGDYTIAVLAGQQPAGPADANLAVTVNGVVVGEKAVAALASAQQTYSFSAALQKGDNAILASFTNDYYVASPPADRNLVVSTISITGANRAVIPCDGTAGATCARQTAAVFGARAWRRALTSEEIDGLIAVYDQGAAGAGARLGLTVMLKAILLSPNFLYRAELDANLTSTTPTPLSAYELASRMSYFLWSSMPDAALFAAAADGTLRQDAVLRAQVVRMLKDQKASALLDNFAAQWLKFDKILEAQPNAILFPEFTPDLKASIRQETRLFMADWFNSNAPVKALLDANYTFLDERLAQYYGVMGISGSQFVRHAWGAGNRRGLLGQASILTTTSHANKTSPVKRGSWVLHSLLCKDPPPPPPNIPVITDTASVEGLTTRQRFEQHQQTSSACYACHHLMDPIGFGLENFNPIGKWRDTEGTAPIDATGSLPGNVNFNGPVDLARILSTSPELPLCTIQQLATYGLGRGVAGIDGQSATELVDYPFIYSVYANTQQAGFKIQDIIQEIVASSAFRQHRGADSQTGAAP